MHLVGLQQVQVGTLPSCVDTLHRDIFQSQFLPRASRFLLGREDRVLEIRWRDGI